MPQQRREAIAGMLRASPFDPAGDLREQRFAIGSAATSVGLAADLGRQARMPVVTVDRLAPEHPYPAAPDAA